MYSISECCNFSATEEKTKALMTQGGTSKYCATDPRTALTVLGLCSSDASHQQPKPYKATMQEHFHSSHLLPVTTNKPTEGILPLGLQSGEQGIRVYA